MAIEYTEKTCQRCAKVFKIKTRLAQKGLGQYCGRSCQAKSVALKPIDERFFNRIDKDSNGCWLWTGTINPMGYGEMSVFGKIRHMHRWSYARFVGAIPESMQVLHRCSLMGQSRDYRHCVNPGHLYLGTDRDNVSDKIRLGNHLNIHNRKLNPEAVKDIVLSRRSGEGTSSIAKRHGVTRAAIHKIFKGKSYRYITDRL